MSFHHVWALVVLAEVADHVLVAAVPIRRSKFEEEWKMPLIEAKGLAYEQRSLHNSGVPISDRLLQQG
jgi:hypothetical protein